MADVTITEPLLAAALSAPYEVEEVQVQVRRLLEFSTTMVNKYAPLAPSTAKNEAAIRVSGYVYDQGTATRGSAYGNAMRNSGATAILSPWRQHRAGSTCAGNDNDVAVS